MTIIQMHWYTVPSWWWQPWANTLLYMPLNDDVLDYSDNHNNWTWSSAWRYWYLWESSNKKCAYIDWNQIDLSTCPIWTGNPWAFTHSCWVKTNDSGVSVLHHFWQDSYTSRSMPIIFYGNNHSPINDSYGVDISLWGNASSSLYNNWMHVVYTYDGSGWHQLYINGSLYWTGSWTLNIGSGYYCIWLNSSSYKEFWLSECIIENKVWTAQEVSDYYTLTSWDYTELPVLNTNIPHIATDLRNYTSKADVLALWWTDITTYNSTVYTLANGNWIEITWGRNAVASLCYQLWAKLNSSKTLTLHVTWTTNSYCYLDCWLMNAKWDGTYTWARVSNYSNQTWIRINWDLSALMASYWDVDYTVTMNFSTWVITLSWTATQWATTFSQTRTMTSAEIQATLNYGYIVFQLVSITWNNARLTSAEYTIS